MVLPGPECQHDSPGSLAGNPPLRRGAPGDDLAVPLRARQKQPRPGVGSRRTPVGTSAPDVRTASLHLVGRPTVDLKRTDSALCR